MMAPPPALAPHENQGWKAREGFGASEDGDVVVNPIKLPFGDVFFPPTWQYWGRFIFGFTRYFAGIQMEYDDAMGFLSIHHGLSRYECAICTHQALLSTFKTFVSY